jgi:hypothetical protein
MSTFFAIGNSCNQRTQQLDSAASSLERNLQTLTIDNTPPNKVEARKNGDCLTGSGVVGTAEFYLPYSSVTLANSQVTKALNYTGTQESQSFILGNHDNDSQVDFIQTKLPSKDGKIYEVNYYFVSSIYCPDHEYESSVCIDTNPPNDSRSHLSDSVQRIEVISREGG